ncbi:MAG: PAS domain S-box protein, partial [Acidobacteriota bacterium]
FLADVSPAVSSWLRAAPMVAIAFALALSRRRLPPRLTAGPATSGLARLAGGQAGVLAAWALLVPAIHGSSYGLGLLAEPFRALREILVVGGVVTLGAAAVWEHQLRRRRLLSARHDQRHVEDTLRTREQDLRLILERRRGRDELRRSEEQFVSAFRASPDGLAISTLDDGRILDVNPSFERIVARTADDLVGHEVASLGLWPELEGRSRIVEIVRRDGAVRDMDVSLTLGGRPLRLRVSFEAIQVGAEVLLLTVLRDRTEEWQADRPLALRAGLLDRSAAAIRGIGADGRTTYHNQASSRDMLSRATPTREQRFEVAVGVGTEPPPDASHPTVRLVFTTSSPRADTTETSEPSA